MPRFDGMPMSRPTKDDPFLFSWLVMLWFGIPALVAVMFFAPDWAWVTMLVAGALPMALVAWSFKRGGHTIPHGFFVLAFLQVLMMGALGYVIGPHSLAGRYPVLFLVPVALSVARRLVGRHLVAQYKQAQRQS